MDNAKLKSSIEEDLALLQSLNEEEIKNLNISFNLASDFLPPRERPVHNQEIAFKDPSLRQFKKAEIKEFLHNLLSQNKTSEKRPSNSTSSPRVKELAKDLGIEGLNPEDEALLSEVTEEELANIAGIIGCHGYITNEQSQKIDAGETITLTDREKKGIVKGTTASSVRFARAKSLSELLEQPDSRQLNNIVRQLKDQDPSLTNLSICHLPRIEQSILVELMAGIEGNPHLKQLSLINVNLNDQWGVVLADIIVSNTTIQVLNLESNRLTALSILPIINALKKNTTIKELRLANQYNILGLAEMDVAKALEDCHSILKLGMNFETASARFIADRALMRNNDEARKKRNSKMLEERASSIDESTPSQAVPPPPDMGVYQWFDQPRPHDAPQAAPEVAPSPTPIQAAPKNPPPPASIMNVPKVLPPPASIQGAPKIPPPPASIHGAPKIPPPPASIQGAPKIPPPPSPPPTVSIQTTAPIPNAKSDTSNKTEPVIPQNAVRAAIDDEEAPPRIPLRRRRER